MDEIYIQERGIRRVYSTFVGGIIATSVILLGNGTASIVPNYVFPAQLVKYSEEQTDMFKSFSYGTTISCNIPIYSESDINKSVEKVLISDDKLESIKKLNIISSLQDNWNGNGSKALSVELIDKVKRLVMFLDVQPDIFPTASGSIQIEYDKNNGEHLEIELYDKRDAELYWIKEDGNDKIETIKFNYVDINGLINEFYG